MMKCLDMYRVVRTGLIVLVLALLPLTVPVSAQTNTNNANTATLREDTRGADEGSDWGWLNWLGLLGLLGLIPRKPEEVRVRSNAPADARR